MSIDYRAILSHDASRERLAVWLRQQREAELAGVIARDPGSITDAQRMKLERIIGAAGGDQFLSVLARVGAKQTSGKLPLVPRYPNDTMQDFIARPPFNLTSGSIELEDGSTISVAAMNNWGTVTRMKGAPFKAPRHVETALKVWRYLDGVARQHGMRVDPWDVFAAIYPPVRTMLRHADANDGVIDVVQPWFMGDMPFAHQAFAPFAQATLRNSLADTDHRGRGVLTGTAYQHASEAHHKPRMNTMWSYATGIARDAHEDLEFANLIFGYEMALRLMPALRATAADGVPVGLVPAVDIEGHNLFERSEPDVQTRHTLRVVPGDSGIAARVTSSRLGDVQLWPSSAIASGEFDLKIAMMRARLASFAMLEGLAITRDDGDAVDVAALSTRIDDLEQQHELYASLFRDRTAKPLSREERLERNAVYQRFNAFVQRVLRYTHVRGTIATRAGDISYELVPRYKGVAIKRVVGDSVTVFGSDVAMAAREKDWEPSRVEAVIAMRVIIAHLEGMRGEKIATDDKHRLADRVRALWPKHLGGRLLAAVDDYLDLESAARPRSRAEATLHRAVARGPLRELLPFYVHLEHLNQAWDALMARSYKRSGWSEAAYQVDRDIVTAYFMRVRHPHFIFDQGALARVIAAKYTASEEQANAYERICTFFTEYGISTDSTPRHSLDKRGREAEGVLAAWAYDDYLNSFSTQYHMDVRVPVVHQLVDEVVDRQLAEHRGSGAQRSQVHRGLLSLLRKHNQGKRTMTQRLEEYPLPSSKVFDAQFNTFVARWRADHDGQLPADEDLLRSMVRSSSPRKVPGTRQFIDEWRIYQSKKVYALTQLIADPTRGIVAFARDHYDAAMYRDDDFVRMATNVVRGRLDGSASPSLMSEVSHVLGDRFNPYPEVRNEAETFLVVAVAHYFNHLTDRHTDAYDALRRVFDDYGDMIGNVASVDAFIGELVTGLTDAGARIAVPSEGAGRWLVAHERTTVLLNEFMGRTFQGGLADRIAEATAERMVVHSEQQQREFNHVREEFSRIKTGLQSVLGRIDDLHATLPARDDLSAMDGWLRSAETTLDELGAAAGPLRDLAEHHGDELPELRNLVTAVDARELDVMRVYEKIESARDTLRNEIASADERRIADLRKRLQEQVAVFKPVFNDVRRLQRTFKNIRNRYRSRDDYLAAHETVQKAWAELVELGSTITARADALEKIVDEARGLEQRIPELREAQALVRDILNIDAVQARDEARKRLLEAEASVPVPKTIAGMAKRTLLFAGDERIIDWMRTRFNTDANVSDEKYERALAFLKKLADGMAILSDGRATLLSHMTDEQMRSFDEWRAGNRSADIDLGLYRVSAHTPLMVAKRPDDVPQHPVQHLAKNLRILAQSKSPEMYFVASLLEAELGGNREAGTVQGQVAAYLAQPLGELDEVRYLVRRIAVSIQADIMRESGFEHWLVKEPYAMRIPLPDAVMKQINQRDRQWINGYVFGKVAPYLDPQRFHSEDFLRAQQEALKQEIRERLIEGGHQKLTDRWEQFMAPESGGMLQMSDEAYPVAAIHAYYVHWVEKKGRRGADIVADDFVEMIYGSLMSGLNVDELARRSLIHFLEHDEHLSSPALIDVPEYTSDVHSMDRPWVRDLVLPYFKREHPSVMKLLTKVMSSPSYLLGGAVLRQVADEHHPLHDLMPTVMRIFREYAGYSAMKDEVVDLNSYNSMGALLIDLDYAYSAARKIQGQRIPAWWSADPDRALAKKCPETGAVRWNQMVGEIGNFGGVYDENNALTKGTFKFINDFPEFAGAVFLHSRALLAGVLPKKEALSMEMFLMPYHAMGEDTTGMVRERVANEFRELYANSFHQHVRRWLAQPLQLGTYSVTNDDYYTLLKRRRGLRWQPRWRHK